MRRPSMRMALVLALLAGVAALAGRVRRGRDAALPVAPAPSTTWPPLDGAAAPRAPAAPAPAPAPAPEAAPAPAPAPPAPEAAPAPAPLAPEPAPATLTPVDAPPPAAPEVAPAPAVPHDDEDDTDPRLFVGVPVADGDTVLDPQPEAVLPPARIEEASAASTLIADGDDAVPPAPEPTFGTAPDPVAAATAPVPVATPVEPEPDEALPVPRRDGADPSGAGAEPGSVGHDADTARWIPPVAGACAPSHPVKARLASRIFHLPGMVDYERTTPDRCYLDAAAAEADGLRAAKR